MSVEKKIQRLDGYIYQDKPNIKSHIFICGLHRSGTTLLEELMSSFFEISCLRMTALKNEGQFAQKVYLPLFLVVPGSLLLTRMNKYN